MNMKMRNKKFIFLPLLVLVIIGVFLVAKPALADVPSFMASVFGWLIMQLVSILGKVLTWVIGLLIEVAQYNGFITAPAVSKGWIIIRDVCNMFFIAALLLIAFGTVLKVEKYSYKRTLGGLLIAAVLINFSKFICGFFIDITQILMLTFVNAFKNAAAGNFLQMLGMDKWLNFGGAQSAVGASALTGAIFALILVIISLIVISVMLVILAFRIVMIWLLVVLSPLVFLLNVFPGKMKSYSNMWWEKFANQLIVGPVMAFFIWLSFAVANQSSIVPQNSVYSNQGEVTETEDVMSVIHNSVSEAANPSNFAKFVVSIAMLMGSLLIAQQLGVAGGKIAGKAVSKIQGFASGVVGKPFRAVKKVAGFGLKEAVRETEAATGIPLTKSRWKTIRRMWTQKQEQRRDRMFVKGKKKGALAFLPKGAKEWAEVLSLKGGPKAIGHWFQGMRGLATKNREEANEKEEEKEEIEEALKTKTLAKEMEKLKKSIDSLNKEIAENDPNKEKFYDNNGEMTLSTVEKLLVNLSSKRDELKISKNREDKAEAKELTNLIDALEQSKEKALAEGESSINAESLGLKNQDLYESESSNFFVENKKSLIEKQKELSEKKKTFEFTEDTHDNIKNNIEGLTAEITELQIDDDIKKEFKDQIEGLLKDIDIPFDDLKDPKKREEIGSRVWQIRKKINQLKDEGKIDEPQANQLLERAESMYSDLNRDDKVSEKEMGEKTKRAKDLKKEVRDLRSKAEIIHPQIMTHEQRLANYRGTMSEYEKLKGIEDSDELVALYGKAEEDRNIDLARAVLMKLNTNGDINEILSDYGIEQNYKGEAQFIKERLTKRDFFAGDRLSEQEAYSFANDLGLQNKSQHAFEFMAPVVRNKKTGMWEQTTEKQHVDITLSEYSKLDPEKMWRAGSWMAIFGKKEDPVTGKRVPIVSDETMQKIRLGLGAISKQMDIGRLEPEHMKNLSHETVLKRIKQMKQGLVDPEEIGLARKIIKQLEKAQSEYWI